MLATDSQPNLHTSSADFDRRGHITAKYEWALAMLHDVGTMDGGTNSRYTQYWTI